MRDKTLTAYRRPQKSAENCMERGQKDRLRPLIAHTNLIQSIDPGHPCGLLSARDFAYSIRDKAYIVNPENGRFLYTMKGHFNTLSQSLPLAGEGGPRGIKMERKSSDFARLG